MRPIALIASTDPQMVELASVLLTRDGFDALVADSPYELTEYLDMETPKLVLAESGLGGSDVEALCGWVRLRAPHAWFILLGHENWNAHDCRSLAAEYACDAVLPRPFRYPPIEQLLTGWGLVDARSKVAVPRPEAVSFAFSELTGAHGPEEDGAFWHQAAAAAEAEAETPQPGPPAIPRPAPPNLARPEVPSFAPSPEVEPPKPAPTDQVTSVPIPMPVVAGAEEPTAGTSELPAHLAAIGVLDDLPLPRILHQLYLGTYSGWVHLTDEGTRRSIRLRAGFPVEVESDDPTDALPAFLQQSGRLRGEARTELAAWMDGEGGSAVAGVKALELLAPEALQAATEALVEQRLLKTFAWRHGAYSIAAGGSGGELRHPGIDPLVAIFTGVDVYYDVGSLFGFFAQLRQRYIVATNVFAVQMDRVEALLPDLPLDRLFSGSLTVEAALTADDLNGADVVKTLFSFLVTDMILPSPEPGAPAPARPRLELKPRETLANYEDLAEAGAGPNLYQAAPSEQDAERVYQEGMRLLRQGDAQSAREFFLEAVDVDPAEATYRVGLAKAMLGLGEGAAQNKMRAFATLDEALQMDPTHLLANLEMALLLIDEGRAGAARPFLEAVLKRAPAHPMALRLLRQLTA